MVKVSGPMMSMAASGTLADTITFASWKGRPYVRERVIPSNPKSGAQTGRRSMFSFLTKNWTDVTGADITSWQDIADQIVASPFNAYLRQNMQGWHNFLSPMQNQAATRVGTPSDNALTSCDYEENRIKLSIAGSALGDAWGIAIFANKATMSAAPTVADCIMVLPDTTIAAHVEYWTPPEVTTWYFDTICFADDGAQAAVGGEDNAAP